MIVKPLLGKAVVPDDSPYTTGGIGLLGTAPSQDAMEECDTLVIAGSSFPYMEFYPNPTRRRPCRSTYSPSALACATRLTWDWSATAGGPASAAAADRAQERTEASSKRRRSA